MKTRTNSVTLSEFELEPDAKLTLSDRGNGILMTAVSGSGYTIKFTQREMVEVGKAMLEAAGAQNISFNYTPKEEK